MCVGKLLKRSGLFNCISYFLALKHLYFFNLDKLLLNLKISNKIYDMYKDNTVFTVLSLYMYDINNLIKNNGKSIN